MSKELLNFKTVELPKPPEKHLCQYAGEPAQTWTINNLRKCKIDTLCCFNYDDPDAVRACPAKHRYEDWMRMP